MTGFSRNCFLYTRMRKVFPKVAQKLSPDTPVLKTTKGHITWRGRNRMPVTFHCPHRGCTNRMPCPTHTRTPSTRAKPYNNTRWRKFRLAYLRQHPLCIRCLAQGITRAATDVDHITPVTGPDDPSFWTGPFQALDRDCHREKTREDQRDG